MIRAALLLAVLPLLALPVALVLEGCGPSRERDPVQPEPPDAWVGPLAVVYRGQISPAQRQACETSIAAVVSEWKLREPMSLPPIVVEVLHPSIATECGTGYSGCALLGRGRVQVVAWHPGYEWSAPSTYHELAHYAYQLRGHTDPRWPTWNAVGYAIGVRCARPDLPPP